MSPMWSLLAALVVIVTINHISGLALREGNWLDAYRRASQQRYLAEQAEKEADVQLAAYRGASMQKYQADGSEKQGGGGLLSVAIGQCAVISGSALGCGIQLYKPIPCAQASDCPGSCPICCNWCGANICSNGVFDIAWTPCSSGPVGLPNILKADKETVDEQLAAYRKGSLQKYQAEDSEKQGGGGLLSVAIGQCAVVSGSALGCKIKLWNSISCSQASDCPGSCPVCCNWCGENICSNGVYDIAWIPCSSGLLGLPIFKEEKETVDEQLAAYRKGSLQKYQAERGEKQGGGGIVSVAIGQCSAVSVSALGCKIQLMAATTCDDDSDCSGSCPKCCRWCGENVCASALTNIAWTPCFSDLPFIRK